jgi:hypothetical protein
MASHPGQGLPAASSSDQVWQQGWSGPLWSASQLGRPQYRHGLGWSREEMAVVARAGVAAALN